MEYELLFFTSVANEDRVETIKKELTEILESSGAKMLGAFTDIGKRKLAYPIKRDTHAFFSWVRFELADENRQNMPEIGKRISLNDKVIRHIIVRADEIGKPGAAVPTRLESERLTKRPAKLAEAADEKKAIAKLVAEIEKPQTEKKPAPEKEKADLSELDEKLNEILEETPE